MCDEPPDLCSAPVGAAGVGDSPTCSRCGVETAGSAPPLHAGRAGQPLPSPGTALAFHRSVTGPAGRRAWACSTTCVDGDLGRRRQWSCSPAPMRRRAPCGARSSPWTAVGQHAADRARRRSGPATLMRRCLRRRCTPGHQRGRAQRSRPTWWPSTRARQMGACRRRLRRHRRRRRDRGARITSGERIAVLRGGRPSTPTPRIECCEAVRPAPHWLRRT